METVRIFDTTLRDGEQAPGGSLSMRDKIEIARLLESLGCDVIEAGFPATSKGEFEVVRTIAGEIQASTVCALARVTQADVVQAGEAVKKAKHGRVHVFCATSKIHLEHKLNKKSTDIIRLSVEAVNRALEYTGDVEFGIEDASRTELRFLEDIVQATIEAGATTINLADTVGYAVPKVFGGVFSQLLKDLPIIKNKGVVLSCHCHNDLGLAVANSLCAIENGARQVECTINGIGERAGNAALEEIVMAMRTRADYYKVETRVDAAKIYFTSRMVSNLTGLRVPRNKPIVGANAFSHESGIHQDGMLKHRETYEIMTPSSVGVLASSLPLGKHSGRNGFRDRLQQLGFSLTDEQVDAAFVRFKELTDQKKEVSDDEVEALVAAEPGTQLTNFELVTLHVFSDSMATPKAQGCSNASIAIRNSNADVFMGTSSGEGPIDAIFSAIRRVTGIDCSLVDYRVRMVVRENIVLAEASVKIERGSGKAFGRALATDILVASATAYLIALNRLRVPVVRGSTKVAV